MQAVGLLALLLPTHGAELHNGVQNSFGLHELASIFEGHVEGVLCGFHPDPKHNSGDLHFGCSRSISLELTRSDVNAQPHVLALKSSLQISRILMKM